MPVWDWADAPLQGGFAVKDGIHFLSTLVLVLGETGQVVQGPGQAWAGGGGGGGVLPLGRGEGGGGGGGLPLAVVSWPSNMKVSTSALISSSVRPTPSSSCEGVRRCEGVRG